MSGIDPLGLACAGVAILCFGSNFLPVKKYSTGDGIFFAWIMSCAILITGMVVQAIECYTEDENGQTRCPQFEPFAMVGGALWATGNMLTVPIIKCIGLGLGMCVWGATNMIAGWATGKFGLFGLHPDVISNSGLNYAGVGMTAVAICLFLFIKPTLDSEDKPKRLSDDEEHNEGLLGGEDEEQAQGAGGEEPGWVEKLPEGTRRIVGLVGSVVAGLFYGLNFTPPSYVAQHPELFPGASSELADYIFPHFCGIFAATTFYMLLYSAVKRNKPSLFPEIVLPGFISGSIWSIAQACWFIANARLSLSIAFPLIAAGPGLVASMWGALAFKEVQGRTNFMFLGAAFVFVVASGITISLSK